MRQGDQEKIYLEWTSNQTSLRVLVLPEEFYCPLASASAQGVRQHAQWVTNGWPEAKYQCKATHWHGSR